MGTLNKNTVLIMLYQCEVEQSEFNPSEFNASEVISHEQYLIKKRIRFLQQSLIQVSFASEQNRPELYKKILETLHSAQFLLIKNKEIQQKNTRSLS